MNSETTIELRGLREDNPRDFLAALGFFECLRRQFTSANPLLDWSQGYPSVTTASELPNNWLQQHCSWLSDVFSADDLPVEIKSILVDWHNTDYQAKPHIQNGTSINSIIYGAIAKLPTHLTRALFEFDLKEFQEDYETSLGSAIRSSLLSQVFSTFDKKKKDYFSEISQFSLANKQGEKYLLYGSQKIVRENYSEAQVRALMDPAVKPVTGVPTLRWSPDEFRTSAYFGEIPDFFDHAPFNVLALVGLTFYPVADTLRRPKTTGISNSFFQWPNWESPLNREEIFSLLQSKVIHSSSPDVSSLKRIGVSRAWKCKRFSDPNKNLFFERAIPIL